MFSELPKLFDRDFVIGYFLPVAMFLAASIGVSHVFGVQVLPLLQKDLVIGTTVIGLISWLGGVLLLVANWNIVRIMEGYGTHNPLRLLQGLEDRRFRQLKDSISRLDKEKTEAGKGEVPLKLRQRRVDLYQIAAERFPHDEIWLLPTAFGNIVRAFETYSSVMYGFEATVGWDRLIAVIPKDYNDVINTAKARVDFWVNWGLLSLLLTFEYLFVMVYMSKSLMLWIPLLSILSALIAASRANASAIEWGGIVKAAFDVFLPDLRKKLELPFASTVEQERQMWTQFSQAITYRLPDLLADRGTLHVVEHIDK